MKSNQNSIQQNDVQNTPQGAVSNPVPSGGNFSLGYVGIFPVDDEFEEMKMQDLSGEAINLMLVVTSWLRTVVSEAMKTKERRDIEKTLSSLYSAMKYADEFHQIQSKCELSNEFYPHDKDEEK